MFHHNDAIPLVLIELNSTDYGRMVGNSIIVNDPYVIFDDPSNKNTRKLYFKTVQYGENFYDVKSSVNHFTTKTIPVPGDKGICSKVINLDGIKNNYVTVLSPVHCITTVHNCLNTIPSNQMKSSVDPTPLSGYCVLMLMTIDKNISHDENIFNFDLFQEFCSCKPNIIPQSNKNKHFGSSGYYFAFGNKGHYGMHNDVSSVSQYSNKKSKNKQKQQLIDDKATRMEYLTSKHTSLSVKSLSRVLPQVKNFISPLLLAAKSKQEKLGSINFKDVDTTKDGIFQSVVCVNSTTKVFHTEKDCTYTLITVPSQTTPKVENKKTRSPTHFMFKLNENEVLALKMKQNVSFIFHGYTLTHRQHCIDSYRDNIPMEEYQPFYNIGCYGNHRLFKHIKKSFERLIQKK